MLCVYVVCVMCVCLEEDEGEGVCVVCSVDTARSTLALASAAIPAGAAARS